VGDIETWELTLLSLISINVKSLNIFADDLVSSFNDNYYKNNRHIACCQDKVDKSSPDLQTLTKVH